MVREKSDRQEFNLDYDLYFHNYTTDLGKTLFEVDFLIRELVLDEPKKILDLGCGIGRHANLLAAYGHEVVGADITQGFLEIARKNARKLGVIVHYVLKDMRDIAFHEEFDRVILLSTTLGLSNNKDNMRILQNISRALKQGGMVCFDTHFSLPVNGPEGLSKLFERAGLTITRIYGGWDCRPFTTNSSRVITIGAKLPV